MTPYLTKLKGEPEIPTNHAEDLPDLSSKYCERGRKKKASTSASGAATDHYTLLGEVLL